MSDEIITHHTASVHTWADPWGLWHARVTVLREGANEDKASELALAHVRYELDLREGPHYDPSTTVVELVGTEAPEASLFTEFHFQEV